MSSARGSRRRSCQRSLLQQPPVAHQASGPGHGQQRTGGAQDDHGAGGVTALTGVDGRRHDRLLARTVTRIGPVTDITPGLVEGLFAADFDHLQRLYERVNSDGDAIGVVGCPACAHRFEVDLTDIEDERLGE